MINIYDLIKFPDKDTREAIRLKYSVFSRYKQIPLNILKKYEGTFLCEFENYEIVITWINEYNHLLFFMLIPLYQAIDTYEKIRDCEIASDLFQNLRALFYYYSEIVSYYIDCAFEKSAQIFNAMFNLRINEGRGCINKIMKEIRKRAEESAIINEVLVKLEAIHTDKYYCDLANIRNKNTHYIKVHHGNLYNVYDPKSKVTSTCVSEVIEPDEVLDTIFLAMELLDDYTSFIESILYKYYRSI